MKKIKMLFASSLCVFFTHAHDYSFLPNNDVLSGEQLEHCSLALPKKNYAQKKAHEDPQLYREVVLEDESTDVMAEYEEYICDNVRPEKISGSMAALTRLGCALLIRYFTWEQRAKSYLNQLQTFFSRLFGMVSEKSVIKRK